MNRLSTLFVISSLTLTGIVSVGTQVAPAQTFTVIHAFTGEDDGSHPLSGLTLDKGGNFYGTTAAAGGTVFHLERTNGNWVLNTLYRFDFGPRARAVLGPDGTLYGTTPGGGSAGFGTVYNLRSPSTTICHRSFCPWTATVLYSFSGGADIGGLNGFYPQGVDPVFDRAGNLYGTTAGGGSAGDGVVFKLTPSGDGWTESVIHNFTGDDGYAPASGMIFDSAGNLYGTTQGGIYGQGTVFRLTYSGSGWVLNTLYTFQGPADGSLPGPLIFDQSGNLYGATISGGPSGGGTVFELMPSGGSWTFALLCDLGQGGGSEGNLAMDAAGNLYGATVANGAFGFGLVFKLTPTDGSWTYTDLHDFTGLEDGANSIGGVTLDANGNVYGTAYQGGAYGQGVAYEIVP